MVAAAHIDARPAATAPDLRARALAALRLARDAAARTLHAGRTVPPLAVALAIADPRSTHADRRRALEVFAGLVIAESGRQDLPAAIRVLEGALARVRDEAASR